MIKKSSTKAPKVFAGLPEKGATRRKRLEIKQIRSFVEKLRDLPDDAPMPDWSELSVGDRFAIALRLIPQDQRDQVLGKSAVHARRYEQGTDIPLTVVSALAAETEIPLEWLVSGRVMPRRAEHIDSSAVMGLREPSTAFVGATSDDVAVQKLAFKVAAGRGALILDEAADHVRFPLGILANARVAAPNARLMEASGDSMRTTINDGDLLLVDISPTATTIVDGKIYVFSLGNEAFVKRLSRTGRRIMMISDNRETFPPQEVPTDLDMRIYGRVMWAGRNL